MCPHPLLVWPTGVKTLLLVRHAQGFHNAAGEVDAESYKREDLADAHLTPRGWRQARALNTHLTASGAIAAVQAVVVSPLTRTLETAAAAFASEGPGARLIAHGADAAPGLRAAAPPHTSHLPFVAHPLCREETGAHPCDRRSPVDALTSRFVGVDFSAVPPGPDALYTPHHREGKDAVRARARDFAAFLLTRPETTLAVVSHAGFLHFFAAELAAGLAPAPRAEAARWFDNAECRTMALVGGGVERGGGGVACYAGGGCEEEGESGEGVGATAAPPATVEDGAA